MQLMQALPTNRPVVFDYRSIPEFLSDLLKYYKVKGSFSLRNQSRRTGACSQALVSQILNGKRKINRENLLAIAVVFKLNKSEYDFLDKKLQIDFAKDCPVDTEKKRSRQTKNHLLTDWVNPYVKDLVQLKGFSLDPKILHALLRGNVPLHRIQKSVDFLLSEGFWRKTRDGKIVPEDQTVLTTNEISSDKIRYFHKKALGLANKGIEDLPVDRRKASTVLISVDKQHMQELRDLVDSFQNQLMNFIETHPNGNDELVQVAIHLTPVGGSLK